MNHAFKSVFAGAIIFVGTGVYAQNISPTSFSDTINVGGMTMENFTVTVPDLGPATSKVDVIFLADNTGSMFGAINNVQAEASALLASLSATPGLDISFGVAAYFGDPAEGLDFGNDATGANSIDNGSAFNLLTTVTSDLTAVEAGINKWIASGGGDGPEGGLYALHQIATAGGPTDGVTEGDGNAGFASPPVRDDTGVGTGLDIGLRDDAQTVIVQFGDIGQHEETVSVAEALSALGAADIEVVSISAGGSLDSSGDTPNQGMAIADGTGGFSVATGSAGTADAILDSIEESISTVDLSLVGFGIDPDLDVTIEQVSADCEDLVGGESCEFKVKFTSDVAGIYDLLLSSPGIRDSTATVSIEVVGGTAVVPLPATGLMLLTGLFGLGAARRLRKSA